MGYMKGRRERTIAPYDLDLAMTRLSLKRKEENIDDLNGVRE